MTKRLWDASGLVKCDFPISRFFNHHMFTEPHSQGLSSFCPLEEGRREALETRLPLSALYEVSNQNSKVCKAIVLPTILYALESWFTCSHNITFLEKFHDYSVRWILEKKWQDKRTTNSVFEEANTTSKEAMIIKHQLRRADQVLRMEDSRLRKQNIYSVLETGTPTRLPTQSCLLRSSNVPIANQAVLHGLVFTVNSSTASRHHGMVFLRRCSQKSWFLNVIDWLVVVN